jgi:hypothetical protein
MTGNITTTGTIISRSGISNFKHIYITNLDGRQTHLPFAGNNQNYIRGKLNIERDELYVGGATTMNNNLSINGSISYSTLTSGRWGNKL